MAGPGKDYTIGKGKLYFDQFASGTTIGTGERYLGNTPELTNAADVETLDHFDADQGLNVKDESITTQNNLTGSFVTDHISPDNIALFFSGSASPIVQVGQTALTDTFTDVQLGRFLQLGVTDLTPTGVREVDNVIVSVGGAPLVNAAANVEIDLVKGRIYIEGDADEIAAGDTITAEYDIKASTRTVVVGSGMEIRGSLRYISANPVGTQKDYYWPYVKITPNGDFALKGDEWMQLPFSFEVLKLGNRERVYTDGAAALTVTNNPATGVPTITGTAQVDQLLACNTAGIADVDGLGAFSYAWLKDDVPIAAATANSYTPVAGDIGGVLKVRVNFIDGMGNAETVISAPTTAVIA